jgi:preprotein translocase subunit SecE
VLRLGAMLGAFAVAVVIMWFTQAGRNSPRSRASPGTRPSASCGRRRKETLQTTGVVFLFVFVMALFLWVVDVGLLWVTQKLLGTGG